MPPGPVTLPRPFTWPTQGPHVAQAPVPDPWQHLQCPRSECRLAAPTASTPNWSHSPAPWSAASDQARIDCGCRTAHPVACPVLRDPPRQGLEDPQQVAGPWDADVLAVPDQAQARPCQGAARGVSPSARPRAQTSGSPAVNARGRCVSRLLARQGEGMVSPKGRSLTGRCTCRNPPIATVSVLQ